MLLDNATAEMRDRLALHIDHLPRVDLARRPRRLSTTLHKRRYAKRRRDALRAAKLCINGASHGPATHGRLCATCRDVHRESA